MQFLESISRSCTYVLFILLINCLKVLLLVIDYINLEIMPTKRKHLNAIVAKKTSYNSWVSPKQCFRRKKSNRRKQYRRKK